MSASEIIKTEAQACIAEAEAAGWTGDEYDLTPADCDAIVDAVRAKLGRKPSREEWADAGYRYVGNAHYA